MALDKELADDLLRTIGLVRDDGDGVPMFIELSLLELDSELDSELDDDWLRIRGLASDMADDSELLLPVLDGELEDEVLRITTVLALLAPSSADTLRLQVLLEANLPSCRVPALMACL